MLDNKGSFYIIDGILAILLLLVALLIVNSVIVHPNQEYSYETNNIKNAQDIMELLSGKIDLKPYNKSGKTPCEYCEYKSICNFNVRQKGNEYRYIDKKSKDDVIRKMSN